ncbi:MAG: M23 family metallopeptidase [Saprospiraceae bacterium]|nr:M23 family metallopeptidase [Saprospiraceae bacterium]
MIKWIFSSVVFMLLCVKEDSGMSIVYTIHEPIQLMSPVKHKLSFSGGFGELRSNHFHAGLDIRSSHTAYPDQILSAQKGFISKIDIKSDGYGKSVFIQHPGGYTTVYGHLERLRPDLEAKIKEIQAKEEAFEVELKFTEDEFPVNASEFFAYMGNTGASRGAHLHFELRKTATNEILDPLEFGLGVEDRIAPVIKRVKIYGFGHDGFLKDEKIIPKSKLIQPISIHGDFLGIAIDAADKNNQSWITTGLKHIRLYVDETLVYEYHLDSWHPEDARYMNAHIDFHNKVKSLGHFHRCYKLPGNCLPIYKNIINDGLVAFQPGVEHKIRIEISDAFDNKTQEVFSIKKSDQPVEMVTSCVGDMVLYDQPYQWDFGFGQINFAEGTLYESTPIVPDSFNNLLKTAYSPWLGIKASGVPIHKKFQISIVPTKLLNPELKSKSYIALKSGLESRCIPGSVWKGDTLIGSHNQMGFFSIMVDTIAPSITPVTFRYDLRKAWSFKFRIRDNVPSTKVSQEVKYKAYIDGKWILMEHDAKTRTIRHEFEPDLAPGKHELVIVAQDERLNQRTYKAFFVK